MPTFKAGDIVDGANHRVLGAAKYKNGLIVAVDTGTVMIVRFQGPPYISHEHAAQVTAERYPRHTQPGTHLLRVWDDYLVHATGFDRVAQIKHRASQRSISELTL